MLEWNKDKPAKRYKRTCQVPYSSYLSDLQRDSEDDEEQVNLELRVELPGLEGPNFKNFVIKHRNTTAIEDVKRVLCSLEKDALLLDLIPIAFDDDMETQAQIHGLFIERVNSINKIWDFIVISFRHFGVPTGLHKVCMMNSKDWTTSMLNIPLYQSMNLRISLTSSDTA